MSNRLKHPTQWKFRHYGGDGNLLWASGLDDMEGNEGNPLAKQRIHKGSLADLDVINDQGWNENTLADEGEGDMLDVYFDAQAVRTTLYGRLWNDTPAETDTLALLANEVSGTGYAAVSFARGTDWGAPALDGGDMMTTSTTKTFTAGGTWTSATYITLDTTAAGTGTAGLLILYVALSATRTLANTETLDVSFTVKLA